MGKYLDSIDYNKIVFNTFQLPESDFLKYYSNKVEDHLADNPDLFDELIAAIKRRIDWYRAQHPHDYAIDEWMTDKDGKIILDENGGKIKVTRLLDFKEADEVEIPLLIHLPGYGLNRSINKSFFDKQIAVIRSLSIDHSLRNFIDKQAGKKKGPRKTRKTESFKDLFISEEIAEKVINILTVNDCLTSGKWIYKGISEKSIATPFFVLRDYFGQIQAGVQLGKQLKIWCSGLGVDADYGYVRNIRNDPAQGKRPTQKYIKEQKEFFKIFEYQFKALKPLPEPFPNKK